jgi:hypothetical protein
MTEVRMEENYGDAILRPSSGGSQGHANRKEKRARVMYGRRRKV